MIRTPVFKFLHMCLHMGAAALLLLAFTIGAAGPQPAQAAPSTASQVSAGWMAFAGSFPDSNIHLNGLVHIVARWTSLSTSQAQVNVDVNLPAASVTVTTDTGIPYIALGAGQSSVFIPNDPVIPNNPVRLVVPSFWLAVVGSDRALPPNPVLPPSPIRPFGLQFDLVFDAAGVLDFNASSVQIVELPDLGD